MATLKWYFENTEIKATPMKRFWLFLNHEYEASGGMRDFYDSYDSIEDATVATGKMDEDGPCYEEGHLYDSANRVIVARLSIRKET